MALILEPERPGYDRRVYECAACGSSRDVIGKIEVVRKAS
jgi:hypothetical protein